MTTPRIPTLLLCAAAAVCAALLLPCQAFAQLWARTSGPPENAVYSLFNRNDTLYAGTATGIYRTNDSGVVWQEVPFGTGPRTIAAFGEDFAGHFYVCPRSEGVHRTTDNGASWQPMNNGLPAGATIYSMAQRNLFMLAGADTGGVYRTSDGGLNWKRTPVNTGWVFSIITKPNAPDVYAGMLDGKVYYSDNAGEDWRRVDSTLLTQTEGRPVRALLYFGNYVYAGVSGAGIFRTNDTGRTWQDVSNGISINDIRALSASRGSLYAGSHLGGAYISKDSGMTWKQAITGLDVPKVRAFAFVGPRPFAATDGGGVFICDLSVIVSVDDWSDAGIALYPNPAPDRIYLDMTLLRPSLCRLSLYNAIGERVAVRVEAADSRLSTSFELGELPSGAYYMEITDGLRRTVRGFVKP
jgi:photosystem II stability/assembly factor-like uncharacterized protein